MASLVYTLMSIANAASIHCSLRPEFSPCTCETVFANNYLELTCEKMDSFHQVIDALSNKIDPLVDVSLKITHSQLEDLEMRSFMDFNFTVVKLRMQWNGLKSLPELPFRGLSKAEYLSVGDNELEEIPKHMLNHMPSLKTLDIGRCRIRSVLQNDFKGTRELKYLFLPCNNITRLDEGVFPPDLVTLHLGRNLIENLNGTLQNLSKLESLFINMNNIESLDDQLPESNRLRSILAQSNRLIRLPDVMRNMQSLETVHLQNNRITSFDRLFQNKRNMTQFLAHENEVEYLASDEFLNCSQLEDIDLSVNRIKSLNFSLLPLGRIGLANFSFNEIVEFSMDEIRGLRYLRQLILSNNHIERLIGRQMNNIDQDSYLIQFNLKGNRLRSLDGALMGLNNLRDLILSNNFIERILPEDFIGLVKLQKLDLSYNHLLTLKEMETTHLPSMSYLNVAYNNITKLEKDFHGLPILCHANLTNNQISSISTELVTKTQCMNLIVPGQLELHLDDNPIMCDDSLNELCNIMSAQKTRIRGRSRCFENDQEEVCSVLKKLFQTSSNVFLTSYNSSTRQMIIQQKIDQQVVPIQPKSRASKKPDENFQSLNKPFILKLATTMPPQVITEEPSTTTTTTIALTTTTTTKIATLLNEQQEQQISELERNIETNLTNYNDTVSSIIFEPQSGEANRMTTTTSTTTTKITPTATTTTTAIKPEIILPPETPQLVLNIDELSASPPSIKIIAPTNENDAAIGGETQKEYETVTVEYMNEFLPIPLTGNHPLEDDSPNSNSVHEEYPIVLSDVDTAPQSLAIPEEPPELP